MEFAPPLIIPLLSALGYALAALMLKRATADGAGPWRIMFITNWVMMAIFSFLWLLPAEHSATPTHVFHAAITGFLFFVGQIFTFLALNRGDVSVATPVLGSKVIFVALFAVLLGASTSTPAMWFAVVLTAAATALLGASGHRADRDAMLRSLLYGFSAAISFALTDVLQQRWVKAWGFTHYAPTMFAFVGLFSLGFIPLFKSRLRDLPAATWRWTLAGGAMLSAQALGIAWGIVFIGATTTNVLYNSRGMWSVVLVWSIGHWFSNAERSHGRAVMLRRLAGSALLLAAIVLITQHHAA
jgi:drug/metabolite transporter (DMT)-like permease